MEYKRIALLGISASGKSFASRVVASKTQLPLFHMDQLFWKGNWEEVPEVEYLKKHEALVAGEKWVIEGYVDEKMANRLRRADLILYLDYSGIRCAFQLIKRWLTHRNESRPELAPEALERFSWSFLLLVFTRGERSRIEGAIKEANPANLYRFSSPKEFEKFLSKKF